MRRPGERGFTLLELLLALTLVGALLAITFGALRVGLASWRRGEDRAEAQQHARSLVQVLARSVSGAHPYQAESPETRKPELLFEGGAERLAFVTAAPPFPPAASIAFTAVSFSIETGERAGLAIRQKPLPNVDAFERLAPVFVDSAVTAVRFRYLHEAGASWQEGWDAAKDKGLPRAVEITLTTQLGGRATEHPPLAVPIPASAR